jgi:hypothetical protein
LQIMKGFRMTENELCMIRKALNQYKITIYEIVCKL